MGVASATIDVSFFSFCIISFMIQEAFVHKRCCFQLIGEERPSLALERAQNVQASSTPSQPSFPSTQVRYLRQEFLFAASFLGMFVVSDADIILLDRRLWQFLI